MVIDFKKMERSELLDFAAYIFSIRNPYIFRKFCFPMISFLKEIHITKDEIRQLEEKACSLVDEEDTVFRNYMQEQASMTIGFLL